MRRALRARATVQWTVASAELPQRIVLDLGTQLRLREVAQVDTEMVLSIENRLMELSNEVTLRFFSQSQEEGPPPAPEGEPPLSGLSGPAA